MHYKEILVLLVLILVTAVVYRIKADRQAISPEFDQIAQIPPVTPIEIPPVQPQPELKIEPQWSNYPPVRQVNPEGLGKILADIDSHMPAGHIYRDDDKITWGHETSHGIASNARMKFATPGKRINAFYCLENRVAVIEEPKVNLRIVAPLVPKSLRANVYDLYLNKQLGSWADTPLYLFDEWIAYTNGSEVRLELKIEKRAETVTQMFEFDVYCLTLAQVVKAKDPNYDDTQFKKVLYWNIERSFNLHRGEATAYLEKFKTTTDAEELRKFTRNYMGAEWTKEKFGF